MSREEVIHPDKPITKPPKLPQSLDGMGCPAVWTPCFVAGTAGMDSYACLIRSLIAVRIAHSVVPFRKPVDVRAFSGLPRKVFDEVRTSQSLRAQLEGFDFRVSRV